MIAGATIISGLGLTLIFISFYLLFRHHRQRRWPKTIADVELCEITKQGPMTILGYGLQWRLTIAYTFAVDDEEYFGDRIFANDVNLTRERAESIAGTIGQQVNVSYNPNNPDECFVILGTAAWSYLGFVTGAVLLWLAW